PTPSTLLSLHDALPISSAALFLVVLYLGAVVVALLTHAPAVTFRVLDWADWALLIVVALALILYGARWDRTSWINWGIVWIGARSEEHTSELQSRFDLV